MARKYFGTDGIRGRVGSAPMTADFVLKLGWAAGKVLAEQGGQVLIGKDTRVSGYMLESALEAGLSAAGAQVRLLGPLPTPGIAYLTRTFHAQAGIVISASHNPFHDNGIKFFGPNGMKLSDETEAAIEAALDAEFTTVESDQLGKASRVEDAAGRYIEFCKSTFDSPQGLSGLHIVLDCANGAAYKTAPSVLRELGAKVTEIGTQPDGLNINEACGSTAPQQLQEAVRQHGANLGIALDGDADRVLLVDEQAKVIDGDQALFIMALHRKANGSLSGPVVGTVMSNLGLELALKTQGIEFQRAKVGDRHVLELLQQLNGNLGGESSGHLLCLDKCTTGDGTVAALDVLAAMLAAKQPLSSLAAQMEQFPQVMINVPIKGRFNAEEKTLVAAVQQVEADLSESGRVVLRPSGTEPVVRVMVEAQDAKQAQMAAESLAKIVSQVSS